MTRSSRTTLCGSISCATGKILLFLVSSLFLLQPVWAAEQDKIRWNEKYATEKYLFGQKSIPFLQDHVDLLPKGHVLDLAMGEGRNGVFLATKGFQVTGVDISAEGLKKAETLAAELGVTAIVMSSYGKTGIKRLLMGSVTQRTIGYANCPVLVVHP